MSTPLTRRQMIGRLAQLTAAAAIPFSTFTSCGDAELTETVNGEPEPYATWERLRAVTRSSSDHFPARLAVVAESADWRAAYRIVRDEFVTLPGRVANQPFATGRNAIRAGAHACERSGMGTPLEQCKVLQRHLEAAGVTTELVTTKHTPTLASYRAQLTRNIPPEYDAVLPKALEKRINQLIEQPAEVGSLAAGPDELKERVFSTLPTLNFEDENFQVAPNQRAPLLLVTTGGGKTFALPIVGDAGDPYEVSDEDRKDFHKPANSGATPGLQVNVSLSAKYRGNIREKRLLDHRFFAPRVAGRHINVLFDNGYPLEALAGVPIGSLTTFTPIFQVARLPGDPLYDERVEETVVGDPFTLFNDKVERTDEGLLINGIPAISAPPRPAIAERVVEIRAQAHALNFPEIRVDVWATDAAGQPVEGLGPADFSIVEDGHPMLGALRRNYIEPRVVIMYDKTTSVPAEFRAPSFYESYRKNLEAAIISVQPNAKIEFTLGDDKYYDNLAKQIDNPPSLIICVSDGLIIGKAEDRHRAILAKLPPVIFIHHAEEEHEDLRALAEVIEVVPVKMAAEDTILAEIKEKLKPFNLPPYQFSYYGQPAESGPTTVTVTANEITGSGTYEVAPQGYAPLLEGLYLDVHVSGATQRFTLGGFDRRVSRAPQTADADDAFNALHGSTAIYVEGGGPTGGVLADDMLSARLTTRGAMLLENPEENFDQFKEELKQFITKDGRALSVVQGLPDAVGKSTLTYPDGLQICICQTKAKLAEGEVETRLSILPTAEWRTIADTPETAFRRTFDHTWHLARAEAALFETTTISLLNDQPLLLFQDMRDDQGTYAGNWDRDSNTTTFKAINGYGQRQNEAYHVISRDRPHPVWFSVDRKTGAVLGVLPDLTGGGRNVKDRMAKLKRAEMSLMIFIQASSSSGLIPAGAFFALVAKLYMIATAHLITLDASMDSRCEIIKAARGAAIDLVAGAILSAYVPRPVAVFHGMIGATGAKVNVSNHSLKDCAGFPS